MRKKATQEPEVMLFNVKDGFMVVVDVSHGPVSIYARDENNVITQLKALGTITIPPAQPVRSTREEKKFLRLATVDGQEIGPAD